ISLAIETSEKTKAVKKLSAREKYLSSIYDTVGDMLFVLSVEEDRYKFSSVNKAFLNTTGLSEEDIIGKHVEEIIPKSNLNTVLSKYKEAIQEKKTVSWEQTSNYRNGTFSEEVTVAPVLDENGNCTDIVGLVHDITERKKAQEHLELKVRERTRILEENNKTLSDEIERRKQAEEQNKVYADIVKNIPVGLTIMQFEDPERPESLKIVLGNLAAEKYINVKSEDFIGKYLKDFSPDTFSSGRYKIYLEAIRTGNVIDLGIVHYPGTENIPENYFRMVAFPLPGNSVAVSMENVTELIRTEKRFQSVVEASPQALFVLGENGHIKLANKEAERLYNYSREELYQMNFTELFPEPLQNDFKEIVESHFSDSLSGKAPFRQKETKGKDKSGNEIPVELSLSLISSKAGLNLLASIMDISERVKAEEQIKVYKDIVKNIPIGLDIMKFEDPENTESLRVVTTNPAFDSFSGLKGKDIIGKYAKEVSPEIFISGKDKVYQKMLQTGKPRDFGTIHHTANGQPESYIHESAFPVSENYVAVSYENVTEQIKTEERFRLVVESAAYAILMNDKSGKIILANSKCKSLFGYRHDELIGMDVGLLVPEHNREAFIKNQVSFFEHPEERLKVGKNIEMNGLRKDGTQVALEVSSSPIYTDNKVYMLSAIADITERKEAESKLKESEARFRSIAENAPVLITRVNRDGIVEYINRVKNKFTIDDVIGHPIYEFIHPESVKIYKEKLAEAFSSGKPTSLEFRGMRDDRSMGWYSAMMAPIKTGEPISSVVVILLDITERKLADQEINFLYKNVEKNNQELEMANKELESFSYSVSHDLRAPLRAIEGYTQVVKDEYGEKFDEDGLHMITAIIGNAKKMGQLIDDLLAFSRLGKKEVQKSMIDVKAMVQTILQEIGTLSWNAQSQVDVKELLPVKGDPILIHQVFYNLIANGLKYSKNKPQPRLEIDSYRKGEFNIYCVKDNGVGFDMKYYDKLFKVFQRLHRADEFEGTGIGLAIIERIVSKHGGKVWAVSKLNEGATFFFSLPAED
ncbi:MAG: multi-sensor signal transduction histidine kinase, partial [Bacteroidetes bacterium]|nr:multi-sensor signal transduction histidine kinase [Bacteroidota bacterium]